MTTRRCPSPRPAGCTDFAQRQVAKHEQVSGVSGPRNIGFVNPLQCSTSRGVHWGVSSRNEGQAAIHVDMPPWDRFMQPPTC
ncbi:hypothetical protein E2C01_042271 [Portunus trituberculatus]|uniref:Uncharacterized protein n=1 Tax=Portunus trituberculatus TaxID=210409 RepID=A0A5B7FSZ6_PORTR|nr:hypothetical protein [Portunus trituberculatus]